jgi:hypothetical protein
MNGDRNGLGKYKVYWNGMLGGDGGVFGTVWGRILMCVFSLLHIRFFILNFPISLEVAVDPSIHSLLRFGVLTTALYDCANDQDPPLELDDSGRIARDGYIHGIIRRYKKREEWEILDNVRAMVESIEIRLGPSSTT